MPSFSFDSLLNSVTMDSTFTSSHAVIAVVFLIFGQLSNWVALKLLSLKRPCALGRNVPEGDGRSSASRKDLLHHVAEPEIMSKYVKLVLRLRDTKTRLSHK